jgi:hypothetical protein
MTAAEVFESVTNGGSKDFSALVRILNANQPWCLIGGLAVNCYVETIYTIDADIVVMTGRLEQAGFQIQKFEHSINAKGRQSQLRIQFTTDVRYQEFLSDKKEHEVLGQRLPVASLDNVIRGEIWAWKEQTWRASKRKNDELDVLRIAETYPKLREKIPPKIVEQLK